MTVSLDKKVENVVNLTKDNRMVSLAKQAAVTLKSSGLDEHIARVVLVLDISVSMTPLFSNGSVAEIVKKALAVGYLLDDNGEVDVILFGQTASYYGSVSMVNLDESVKDIVNTKLQGATNYDLAINAVKALLAESPEQDYPTLVQFITDGAPSNERAAEKAIKEASKAGVFFQFVGVGDYDYDPRHTHQKANKKSGFFGWLFSLFSSSTPNNSSSSANSGDTFKFLKKLDDLQGRHTDNAGFFAVKKPQNISEEKYYDLLLSEYPNWVETEFPKTNLSEWI